MDVGVSLEQVAARVHDGDHTGPGVGGVAGGIGDELGHGRKGGLAEPAQEFAVVEEVGPQHLRHAEGPQEVAHLGEGRLAQEGAEDGGALGGAGGPEASTLARESEQILGPAGVAPEAGEARFEKSAIEEGVEGLVDAATPEAVASLEALLPEALDLLVAGLDEAIQRRESGTAWPIEGRAVSSQGEAPSLLERDGNRPRSLSGATCWAAAAPVEALAAR